MNMQVKCANCKNEIATTPGSPDEEKSLLEQSGWEQAPDGSWTGCKAGLAGCAKDAPPPDAGSPPAPALTPAPKKKGKKVT